MELDCQKIDKGLVEFLYGEIDDQEASAFERHLRGCPKCAAAADQMRETRSLFSQLALAEPPPIGEDDPILAAAFAKADEMATSAERIATAAVPSTPSIWERIVGSLRGAAFRPALGSAFMVVLVAGVGLLFLADRPRSASEGALTDGEGLTSVPVDEVRSARAHEPAARAAAPAAPIKTATPATSMADAVASTPTTPVPEKLTGDPIAPQTPPSPATRAERRAPRPPTKSASRTKLAHAARPSADNAQAHRPAPYDRSSSPTTIVVEAERIPALRPGAEGAPTYARDVNEPALTMDPPTQVIPTPPLPQAGIGAPAHSLEAQQAQPVAQPQAPTPAAAGPGAVPGAGAAPVRVPTPGQRRYEQGMQAYRSGQYRNAADELNAFVRSPSAPRHLMPSAIHHLAMSQRRAGNLAVSARTYDQLLRGYQGYQRMPQAMLEAAQVNAQLGRWTRAENLLRQLSSMPGWSTRAQSELARVQHRRSGQNGLLGPDSAAGALDDVESVPDEAADEPAEAAPGY